jgi:hypothetical protein
MSITYLGFIAGDVAEVVVVIDALAGPAHVRAHVTGTDSPVDLPKREQIRHGQAMVSKLLTVTMWRRRRNSRTRT